jgi:Ca2+-binding RTX toxin-like protein
MSGFATIAGSDGSVDTVTLFLNPDEVAAAQAALNALGGADSSPGGTVLGSTKVAPIPGELNVYNFGGNTHDTTSLPSGAQAIALTGTQDRTLVGHSGTELLIGNAGNDSIDAGGGSGTIIAGDGSNTVSAGDGNMDIFTGTGHDTINLGSGSDTVNVEGSATLYGASDATSSGSVTILGGQDTYVGGSGQESVDASGAPVDFQFYAASLGGDAGSQTTISGFDTANDKIDLFGYDSTATNVSSGGGNTTFTLSDGTKIVVNGTLSNTNINYH